MLLTLLSLSYLFWVCKLNRVMYISKLAAISPTILEKIMKDSIFFEIPIYRCSIEKHSKEVEMDYQMFADKCHLMEEKDIKGFYYTNMWNPWKYNDVIGYLNLYILGNQFRVDLWKVDKERYNKGITKKQFKYFDKSLQATIPRNLSSIEILEFIKLELTDLNKREFKNRYFDLEAFTAIADFVNWKELVEKLNPYNS